MGKKIIILNGSPRKNGNTSALCKAFREGAESNSNTVSEFFLDGMDINGCKGCCKGDSHRENPCTQNDDMAQIYPVLKDADVIVFASPLYCWTISGQLRVALDRFYALSETDHVQMRNKSCVLLMAAAGDLFEQAVGYYDFLAGRLGWNNLGHVLAAGNWGIGDIEGKKELAEAYELGKSI